MLLLLPLRVLLELEEEGGKAEEEKEGAEGNAEPASFSNKNLWNTWNCGDRLS
jgi:hypothetical protein